MQRFRGGLFFGFLSAAMSFAEPDDLDQAACTCTFWLEDVAEQSGAVPRYRVPCWGTRTPLLR